MTNPVIDCHVHYGSPDDPATGCYWSDEFEKTPAFLLMRSMTNSLFGDVTIKRAQKLIFNAIKKSKKVDQVVLLALDEVYDPDGLKHKEWTHLHATNSYIAKLAEENERILFGASVHPYRNDWQEELKFCVQHGAVLCKWVPSTQQIDPRHEKCLQFYDKLVEYQLPLLCHAGPEYAIPTSNDDYNTFNNPRYLEAALDKGVTVIIAHCALPYFGVFEQDYTDDYNQFMKMMDEAEDKGWNFYADLSADASTFRRFKMDEIVKKVPHERLLFGSDYPIPASILSYSKIRNFFRWLKYVTKNVIGTNPLDKNYNLINKMGFDPVIYTTAGKLFEQIKRPQQG